MTIVTTRAMAAYPIATLSAFGAKGDGTTNDTVIVKAALESGYVIDGLNKTYGISGLLQPSSFKGLVNAKLIQLSPTGASNTKTLHINTKNDWMINNVEIDCGSVQNYPATGDITGTYCGFRATSCNRFSTYGLTVKNGGPFNGIMFSSCTEWTAFDCKVKDFTYNLAADPSDEVIQGIFVQLCDSFSLLNCRVKNMLGYQVGVLSQARSRGIAFAGNTNGRIIGNYIEGVDEAFDFTGTDGSNYMLVSDNIVYDVASYGYKFTGGAVNNLCTNNIARKAGLVSFICIGGSGAVGQPHSHGMIFRNCHSYDVGGNSIPFYGTGQRYGFRVSAGSGFNTEQYSVTIDGCSAVDDQLVPTMDGGAYTDVVATAGVARNVLKNFVSRGHISFAASGFSLPSPRMIHSGMQPPDSGTVGNDTISSQTATYRVEIYIPESMNITGFAYLHGTTHLGNVKLGLSDANGFVVASTASTAVNTNDNGYQRVAASATYFAVQGTYFLLAQFSDGTSANRLRTHTFGNFGADSQTSQVYGTLVDATGPTTFTANVGPIMSLY